MKKCGLGILVAILLGSLSAEAQIERSTDFHSRYTFNHDLTRGDWEKISAVKDYYGDILFTAPLVAVNVAHPLLQTILNELRTEGRQFTFLCGHDSNLGSVLAALGLTEYKLPEAIESKTPIGSKLVFEKWLGADGKEYVAMNLVYQSVDQLRQKPLLMLENRPMVFPISLEGLMANRDGLYLLSDLEARFEECIAAYYQLLTGINAEVAISRQEPCFLQLP